MIQKTLLSLYERDLNRLIKELEQYADESALWVVREEINNSAGNLALHLIGNLRFYIGATLGHTGYVRDRDGEFSKKDIPKNELIAELQVTKSEITEVFGKLKDSDLIAIYPQEVFGKPMTLEYFLIHLNGHLNYHLGQINYHRRLLTT